MLTIWRGHTANCPHRSKGRTFLKCNCPLWGDGAIDGKRVFRQSLGTRDMARARKKAIALELTIIPFSSPLGKPVKRFWPIAKAKG